MRSIIRAQVNFYGTLRGVVDEKRVEITLPKKFSMEHFIDVLAERCGPEIRNELRSESLRGYLQGHVRVFIGGHATKGFLDENFGPFAGPESEEIDVYIVPNAEGGEGVEWH